jgi:hypothetical protein
VFVLVPRGSRHRSVGGPVSIIKHDVSMSVIVLFLGVTRYCTVTKCLTCRYCVALDFREVVFTSVVSGCMALQSHGPPDTGVSLRDTMR